MDDKGRWGIRNWEFSDHTRQYSDTMLKHETGISAPETNASPHEATFLKMNGYTDRNALVHGSDSEVTSMEFSWIPHQNFSSSTRTSSHLQATQVSQEMIETPSSPSAPKNTLQTSDHETKPMKARKKRSSAKEGSRIPSKVLRPKEPKKQPSATRKKRTSSLPTGKHERKDQDYIAEGATLDFSDVPVPVCSCTGVPRQCYRWGAGGWQSSCCTTSISEYPLPMSSSRPGARLAGRKMSIGAYGKLLQRLAAEGRDLSYAVDLKDRWARHGTNKFVTIK